MQDDFEVAFDLDTALEAAERWHRQKNTLQSKKRASAKGDYDALDDKVRLAKRANRLLRSVRDTLPQEEYGVDEDFRAVMDQGEVTTENVDSVMLERIIGTTNDLLAVRFFDNGKLACRSVCRMMIRIGNGKLSYGTGFMVSPSLLLTNHHVLPSAEVAARTVAQFRFEPGDGGGPPIPEEFALRPERLFLNDKDHDFALVAVAPKSNSGGKLSDFGFCPLIAAEGKILPGEPVNIIQHPLGQPKQVVIRKNSLLDLPKPANWDPALDRYAQYEADTERGSSGSPVFNDQWEVVALHHSGVPKTNEKGQTIDEDGNVFDPKREPSRIVWIGNEGIRISRLMKVISEAKNLSPEAEKLRKELLDNSRRDDAKLTRKEALEDARSLDTPPRKVPRNERDSPAPPHVHAVRVSEGSTSVTIPLTITVSLGSAARIGEREDESVESLEAITPDEDYTNRPGFDVNFLGSRVALPKLDNTIAKLAVPVEGGGIELKYFNYSVIMNSKRRLAFVSAVNLSGKAPVHFAREGKDRWFFDPRIEKRFQIGNELYAGNPLDRGHLTRRNDAAWGDTKKEAKLANDDTFHFTNCSPQHEIFNQSTKADQQGVLLWGNIEKHIEKEASRDGRLCVFNGPVFRGDDRKHRDIPIPREYWKVVVCKSDSGKLKAVAFRLSQEDLIADLPEEEFQEGPYRPFQVKIAALEQAVKLDFGDLHRFDPLESTGNESFMEEETGAVKVESLRDIVL
jgi:endonuclease G